MCIFGGGGATPKQFQSAQAPIRRPSQGSANNGRRGTMLTTASTETYGGKKTALGS